MNVALPYEYYSFPVCIPDPIVPVPENLGQILYGQRIFHSDYMLKMQTDEKFRLLTCGSNATYGQVLSKDDITQWHKIIAGNYYGNWIVDNLPSASKHIKQPKNDSHEMEETHVGFALGKLGLTGKTFILNNHFDIKIKYHIPKSERHGHARVVYFEVAPSSIDWEKVHEKENELIELKQDLHYKTCTAKDKCTDHKESALFIKEEFHPSMSEAGAYNVGQMAFDMGNLEPKRIFWTYSVTFDNDPKVAWASRWDVYFRANVDDKIHWFSIVYSILVVVFLSGMIALIMLRILSRDVKRYNELQNSDEAQEETGWKLIYGDVFRPPSRPSILAFFTGTGVQVCGMAVVTLIFALFGFLSPANRGGLMTAMLVFFVFMGTLNGYFSARVYKMCDGTAWKRLTLKSALVFPGIVFAIFLFLNFIIWGERSAGAIPFGTIFALMGLWFGVSVPLVFLGAYIGFRRQKVNVPVRTNQIPRQIPPQACYMRPLCAYLTGGILPFGAVFIELFFILNSMWQRQVYYLFGFLFLVFVILIVTSAEITVVMCYFQLCAENYNWWWRSFITPGFSAFYLFLYTICYFFVHLRATTFVSAFLFFGYMTMISILFFVVTGSVGFMTCLWFVKKIYGSIKVD
eukprot:gnl/Trimastix_PCT/2428.p1 GENE.gnl/Trimastix_PCT/2428~~gnl/Trimastix_PCT/2428.p1  ORF type:complete len:630 (+),score=131.84 gnl/Trimastix_PCT/2428:207-2096(+)